MHWWQVHSSSNVLLLKHTMASKCIFIMSLATRIEVFTIHTFSYSNIFVHIWNLFDSCQTPAVREATDVGLWHHILVCQHRNNLQDASHFCIILIVIMEMKTQVNYFDMILIMNLHFQMNLNFKEINLDKIHTLPH